MIGYRKILEEVGNNFIISISSSPIVVGEWKKVVDKKRIKYYNI